MRLVCLLVILVTAQTADARPPPDDYDLEVPRGWREDRAFLEWSTSIRLAGGIANRSVDNVPRTTQPVSLYEHDSMLDAAIGIDATFPIPTSRVRMGPWLELNPQGVFAGGELTIAGGKLDMFFYNGEKVWALRAGSSMTHVMGALAFGYRCPWKLWGPYSDATRYMIGARFVATGTRSVENPNDWAVTFGLEFEPVGSLRYLLGIRDWY